MPRSLVCRRAWRTWMEYHIIVQTQALAFYGLLTSYDWGEHHKIDGRKEVKHLRQWGIWIQLM